MLGLPTPERNMAPRSMAAKKEEKLQCSMADCRVGKSSTQLCTDGGGGRAVEPTAGRLGSVARGGGADAGDLAEDAIMKWERRPLRE
ncbi:hypothetical protein GW17_00058169 [Ensete ventricosum]|nr:hypothetical protein GW17_00058169 [Ensete ventricosum]RZS11751.1 hypothetical protein BHM03_00043120 [Ensete ventricosum]